MAIELTHTRNTNFSWDLNWHFQDIIGFMARNSQPSMANMPDVTKYVTSAVPADGILDTGTFVGTVIE